MYGAVALAHLSQAGGGVRVELRHDQLLEQREDVLDEGRAAGDPLEVRAIAVVVGPVQPRAREARDEPAHERLVANVLAQHDMGLLAVAAEATPRS